MADVVIVEAGRSPIGKRNGSLAGAHPADVLGPVMMEVLNRAGVDSAQVGQVVGGCINKVGAQAMNITRTAWLSHGGDENVACTTIDSQCGSSQQAVNTAHALIASGVEDIVLACGVENMSLLPIGSDAVAGAQAGYGKPVSRSYFEHYEFTSQFEGAERIADKYGISREDTDRFGLESQERAAKAIAEGRFEHQIIPIEAPVLGEDGKKTDQTMTVTRDEIPRETSLEKLATLKPVARPDGVHTAGSSSQIADGASAVLLMSAEKAAELGVTPLARVLQSALVGCDPVLMLEGPIPATRRVLERQGLTVDDIDVFEINEAFASVVLAWAKELEPDMAKVNPNGGAIALGHPLGGTGCFLTTKAVHELQRTGGRYAVITMCCGGGLGTGTLIERI
ncbi:MAG: steroid 3-ketoacyl-CoA thiolase [Acidimicrobiia bacterium]|nr:steroid 3-ketoacyl-CoA thiolase [Acidimicrobiia bacterium]MDH4363318.1 steroid 3-ketoacyl-CoA thiolase [Acidimicrobiia bacterium]MDH5288690.1 steroid 3-ketoacyl-CoA thiolase [Acidimicrobiia bacterium]